MKNRIKKGFTEAKLHDRFEESGMSHIKTAAFTLIELIVVMAWRENVYGQLGDGTNKNKPTPTLIPSP